MINFSARLANTFFIIFTFICVGALQAHEGHIQLPPISASYQTTLQSIETLEDSSVSSWYFWREQDQVEIYNLTSGLGEKWQRQNDEISYSWISHEQEFLIHYMPIDLSLLRRYPDWASKSSIINPELIENMEQAGQGEVSDYSTDIYLGMVNGLEIEVEWIAELSIPARIKQTLGLQVMEIKLIDFYPLDQSPIKSLDSSNYENMDYADVGDNESHPVIQQHLQSKNFETAQYVHGH